MGSEHHVDYKAGINIEMAVATVTKNPATSPSHELRVPLNRWVAKQKNKHIHILIYMYMDIKHKGAVYLFYYIMG